MAGLLLAALQDHDSDVVVELPAGVRVEGGQDRVDDLLGAVSAGDRMQQLAEPLRAELAL